MIVARLRCSCWWPPSRPTSSASSRPATGPATTTRPPPPQPQRSRRRRRSPASPPTTSTRRAPSRARRTPTRSPSCSTATRRRRGAPRRTSRTSVPAGSRPASGLVLDLGATKGVRQVDGRPLGGARPSLAAYVTVDRAHRHRRASPRSAPPRATASSSIDLDEAVSGQLRHRLADLLPRGRRRLPRHHRRGAGARVTTRPRATSAPTSAAAARTSTATPRPSACSSPGTATGCGRSRCAPWATPRTPPTGSRTA